MKGIQTAALLVLLSGCATSSFQPKPVASHQPPIAVVNKTPLLESPRNVADDYVYPRHTTSHVLAWNGSDGGEWKVKLDGSRYAFAGLTFRRPYDAAACRGTIGLKFRLSPASAVKYLAIALVDGDANGSPVLVEVPLPKGLVRNRMGCAHVDIHLALFGNTGCGIDKERLPDDSLVADFDWSDIREIRLVSLNGKRPDAEVTIRDLRFEKCRHPPEE